MQHYEEFKGCEKCDKYGGYYFTKDDDGEYVAHKCQCLIDYQRRERLLAFLYKANIPPSFREATFKDYIGQDPEKNIPRLKQFVSEFGDRFYRRHLYLYGDQGTQKTTQAMTVGKTLIEQGYTVHYTLMDLLIKNLMGLSFGNGDIEFDRDVRMADCLILDEAFDPKSVTLYHSKYQISYLTTFLKERLEMRQKSVIFISEVPVDRIGKVFDESLQDVIERNTQGTRLHFSEHYSLKDDFDPNELWDVDKYE